MTKKEKIMKSALLIIACEVITILPALITAAYYSLIMTRDYEYWLTQAYHGIEPLRDADMPTFQQYLEYAMGKFTNVYPVIILIAVVTLIICVIISYHRYFKGK